MPTKTRILRVAVHSPLYQLFDYLPPAEFPHTLPLVPGTRLLIPFGRRQSVAVLIDETDHTTISPHRLRRVLEILDDEPAIPQDMLELLVWTYRYYHAPPGEAIFSGLPPLMRRRKIAVLHPQQFWRSSPAGQAVRLNSLTRAPRQQAVMQYLNNTAQDTSDADLSGRFHFDWRAALRRLQKKGWVVSSSVPAGAAVPSVRADEKGLRLNPSQQEAVTRVINDTEHYRAFLLEGVTGSGKTEVYLRLIEQVLEQKRQALLLVPEIGLTPQLIRRFRRRFTVPIALYHSGCTDRERFDTWIKARDGGVPIIIGTRSAVFVPLRYPGIIILDEEHDSSFKQQDGLRYHARDVAVKRAQMHGIPIILGSATPSLESVSNARQGRYEHLLLPDRVGGAGHPRIRVIDTRRVHLKNGLSAGMMEAIDSHLQKKHQVLVYLNRRGFAPTVLCHNCGWLCQCQRCDAHMVLHQAGRRMYCHHCGAERQPVDRCPQCTTTSGLHAMGQGTERIEEALGECFKDYGLVRIDRDTTRRKGSFETLMEQVREGHKQLLIGTQMLTKGHHLPDITLVCIVDGDQGLFSIDFRAPEKMAQQIVQVAGRSGRVDKAGEVLIQTHFPDHPLLQALIAQGYPGFVANALAERRQAALPPFAALALLRAEAGQKVLPYEFLQQAKTIAQSVIPRSIEILGPVKAPMERKAGRFRAQLLIHSEQRTVLQRFLDGWVARIAVTKTARRVRWSLDVDPVDLI